MFGFKWIVIAFAMLAGSSLAAPKLPASPYPEIPPYSSHAVSKPNDKRQALDIASIIIDIATNVFDLVSSINDAQHAQEGAFTQGIVAQLRSEFPSYNVLVYHDQDSGYELYDAYHQHVELDLTDSLGTKGYEVWVFAYGTFELAGDGGYENWAFGGSFERADPYVTFYSLT